MKSIFIGFIALSATFMLFAQIPALKQNKRVTQALAPLYQANVSTSVNASAAAVILAQGVIVNASIQASFAASNASLVSINATFAGVVANATQALIAVQAVNTTTLITALTTLVVAQAAQSAAAQMDLVFDSVSALATTLVTKTTAAAQTQGLLDAAALLATNLQANFGSQKTINSAQQSATSLASTTAQSAAQANPLSPTLAMTYTIAQALYTAMSNIKGSFNLASAAVTAGQSAAVTAQTPTLADTAAAVSAQDTAATSLTTASKVTDTALSTANAALLAAQASVSTAYAFYLSGQTAVTAQQVNASAASVYSNTQAIASNLSQWLLTNNTMNVTTFLSAANQSQTSSQTLAQYITLQTQYRCTNAQIQVSRVQAIQVKACQGGKKASPKGLKAVACAAANVNLDLATKAQIFACSN